MSDQDLMKRIAYNESLHDQLATELDELDGLLKSTGFPRGVASVKEVALEMLQDGTIDVMDAE